MAGIIKQRLAHICILVRDIDQAIEHYTNILGAVCPLLLKEGVAKEERPESPLFKRLEKHGEGLHHIAFASTQLEDTFQQMKKKGVSLHGDQFIFDANAPDTRWVWIMPQYAHGVLIEVMDEYKPIDG
ncbi:MAG: VOC family protein [Deltaproteobacteria bacterium]|nr:VOC family protein [Deltaproteobacteria bacterium]